MLGTRLGCREAGTLSRRILQEIGPWREAAAAISLFVTEPRAAVTGASRNLDHHDAGLASYGIYFLTRARISLSDPLPVAYASLRE